jgi:glycosyltransferase involved in cell wall biosynthesis
MDSFSTQAKLRLPVRPTAIHQFSVSSIYGDGVTNGMLFVQRILRDSAIESEIFSFYIDPKIENCIHNAKYYRPRANDVVLVHYALGSEYDQWVEDLEAHKVLVYHNITPAAFFESGSYIRSLAERGRQQLSIWSKTSIFRGAIGDSDFNAAELLDWGYKSVASIGLLVDLDLLRQKAWNREFPQSFAGVRTLLFVGRICENKGQLELVQMMGELRKTFEEPVQLLLVGDTTTLDYEQRVRSEIERSGLSNSVRLLGKLADADIVTLYRFADVYVSLSEHEGFGMPLVEAMAFDLPVVAADAGATVETLGTGGLVLARRDPLIAAAAVQMVMSEPSLRRDIIRGQRRSLMRFERSHLVKALEGHLRSLGFDVQLDASARAESEGRTVWSVEGPYDSSYSLAVVNREFARALDRGGQAVALGSRDGPGAYPPSEAFLAGNADIAAMARRHDWGSSSDVSLRFQYPPHVSDMRGAIRVLANYAWEESGFPSDWVDEINVNVDLVTVASRYVGKVLRDNGVHAPIFVTGYGVDQILRRQPSAITESGSKFRFLHVSSCFPRKGVDALLAAWGDAFDANDAVELVIKTFPNPHNQAKEAVASLKGRKPDHAPIRLINDDYAEEDMRTLLSEADAVVCPSRGEGFCLPLAEAMALGKSVITTAFGGQSDFCRADIAWLCDYRFAYSSSHLGVLDSVWVEPDISSLAEALKACAKATGEERRRRSDAGRQLILQNFTWDNVVSATREAIALATAHVKSPGRLPRIAWITSWNSRCGIAAYSMSLAESAHPSRLRVYADYSSTPLGDDAPYVHRCWTQSQEETLEEVYEAAEVDEVDAIVVQYNFGFFSLATLGAMIERFQSAGKPVFLTLHSTADADIHGTRVTLQDHARELAKACRILVHSVNDLNRLKQFGLIENVSLFPMGLPQLPKASLDARLRSLTASPLIATFGYLLPNKGLRELIAAFALVRVRIPGARLLMLNARYPAPQSKAEEAECLLEIKRLSLADSVTLRSDFLAEADVLRQLTSADLIVYPYQATQESSSAAVKMGLGSGTPVACTPLDIFADVASVTHALPGHSPDMIASGIIDLLSDPERLTSLAAIQRQWISSHGWPRLARRLHGLIRGETQMLHLTKIKNNRSRRSESALT